MNAPEAQKTYRVGELYISNEEFRAFYDRFAPGLAVFRQKAMTHYAQTNLSDS